MMATGRKVEVMPHSPELELMLHLAREAGEILRSGFGTAMQVEHKGPVDLVTEFDRRSEALILEAIRREYPADGILSEESGSNGVRGGRTWIVDPLDGTTNFAHGIPVFAITMAVMDDRGLHSGVVYDPLRQEMFWAERGGGAFREGRRLQVSQVDDLRRSLLVTGFPYDIATSRFNNLDHYANFAVRCQGVRRLGSAALDLAYLAAGRFEGYWDLQLSVWDVAAGALLIQEAGGRVTNIHGGDDFMRQDLSLLATNGRLHPAMLQVLQLGAVPQAPVVRTPS
jgi:myo-inositol-1(or 4)-monophosphatase